MPLSRTLIALAALGLAAPATAQDAGGEAPAEYDAETVIARVGEAEITLGHVALMVSQLPEQYRQLPDQALYDGIVEQLISQELLARETVESGEVPAAVELTLENERRALLARAQIDAVMGAAPDEEALRAAYEAEIAEMEPEMQFNASHILLETEEAAAEALAEVEGGADFAEVARARSTGPTAENGGNLGWFGSGQMVPAFDQAVRQMESGEIAGPVQTQFGWHVIRLNETRESELPSFEDMRGELAQGIQQQRLQERIAELREAAEVEDMSGDIPAAAIRDTSVLP